MATTPMPARGHSTAPKFSPDQPRELRRYFLELENLFPGAGITTDAVKKEQACRYLDFESAELWQTIASYATGSYDDWKTELYRLYPGAEADKKYTVTDMDQLVGGRYRTGIYTLEDLASYYRSFLTITSFLINGQHLTVKEQNQAFIRGFQATLLERIQRRLEIKVPDQNPREAYAMDEVHSAAVHILEGAGTSAFAPSPIQLPAPVQTGLKAEDLTQILDKFTQTIISALSVKSFPTTHSSTTHEYTHNHTAGELCFGCGERGHLLPTCKQIAAAILAGKCHRNHEGKIVLSTGAFIPRNIPGATFIERIDEWHRRNPGQITKGQMSSNANTTQMMYDCIQAAPIEEIATVGTMRLSAEDRIAMLEQELMTLRGKQVFDGVEIVRPSKGKAKEVPIHVAPAVVGKPTIGPIASTSKATSPSSHIESQPPIHPFANISEAQYIPPTTRNFAAPAEKASKEKEPAYRTVAPIQDPQITTAVYERSMKSPFVTLTPAELLAISPDYRQKMRDSVTPKRVFSSDEKGDAVVAIQEAAALPFSMDTIAAQTSFHSNLAIPPAADAGGIIVPDIYETYLNNLHPDEKPEELIVAKESHSLRSVMILVDNQELIESVVDPGSQIIAMSDSVCNDLGIPYDPSIRLTMQSANGTVDRSLGLARNIPCRFGEITLYLQIHVIPNPAYDILLGRPFDVLTQSMIKNHSNEDQTITMYDPNSKKVSTIPTLPRGKARFRAQQKAANESAPAINFRILSRN
jgi:hypothetical protein